MNASKSPSLVIEVLSAPSLRMCGSKSQMAKKTRKTSLGGQRSQRSKKRSKTGPRGQRLKHNGHLGGHLALGQIRDLANRLLGALPLKELKQLQPHLEEVDLPFREVLYE